MFLPGVTSQDVACARSFLIIVGTANKQCMRTGLGVSYPIFCQNQQQIHYFGTSAPVEGLTFAGSAWLTGNSVYLRSVQPREMTAEPFFLVINQIATTAC